MSLDNCEIGVLEATVERLRKHFRISSCEPTGIPCANCGGPMLEYSIPNDTWNLVVRRGGPEGNNEYLCYSCWLAAVGAEIERLRAELDKADDHPLVIMEGGTSGIDRCHRVINRQFGLMQALRNATCAEAWNAITALYEYVKQAERDTKAAEAEGGGDNESNKESNKV